MELPYYLTDEHFFFSGSYDDSLINEFMRKLRRELYLNTNMSQYAAALDADMGSGIIPYMVQMTNKFVIDTTNNKYNVEIGSTCIEYSIGALPIADRKKFMKVYGYNKLIPIIDTMTRKDIFSKAVLMYLNSYLLMKCSLVIETDNKISVIIRNSTQNGVTESELRTFINDRVQLEDTIYLSVEEHTPLYYTNGLLSKLATVAADPLYYDITIPKTAMLNKSGSSLSKTSNNSWDCYITDSLQKYGYNILISSIASLFKDTATEVIFRVRKEFIDYVRSVNSSVSIAFINRPHRSEIITHAFNEAENSFLHTFKYKNNPPLVYNVYVFDPATQAKNGIAYNIQLNQDLLVYTMPYFPSTYRIEKTDSVTHTLENLSVMVEATEYPVEYTSQKMYNPYPQIMKSLDSDKYSLFIANLNSGYFPGVHSSLFTLESYMASPYYGNLRAYLYSILIDAAELEYGNDITIYNEISKWLEALNPQVLTEDGTPKSFKLGGSKRGGEFTGSNPAVLNTSFISQNPDDIYTFNEPHTYMTYKSAKHRAVPCMLYIAGRYYRPTLHRYYNGLNYIFISVAELESRLASIKDDAECSFIKPIVIDIYPDAYLNHLESPSSTVTINSATEGFKIFTDSEDKKFSLSDLIVYDAITNEFIDLIDNFDILLEVDEYTIDNPEHTEVISVNKGDSIEYMLTSAKELYQTMDLQSIILSKSTKVLKLDDYLTMLNAAGKYYSGTKKLDFSDITLLPNNDSVIGKTITFKAGNFKHECVGYIAGMYDNMYVCTFNDIKLPRNLHDTKNLIFINNCSSVKTEHPPEPDIYNGSMSLVAYAEAPLVGDIKTILVHLPIPYRQDQLRSGILKWDSTTQTGTTCEFYMRKSDLDYPELWSMIEVGKLPVSTEDPEYGIFFQATPITNVESRSLKYYGQRLYSIENPTTMTFAAGLRYPKIRRSTNSMNYLYYENRLSNYIYSQFKVFYNIPLDTNITFPAWLEATRGYAFTPLTDGEIIDVNSKNDNLMDNIIPAGSF